MYATNRKNIVKGEELTITSTNLNGLTEFRSEEIKTLADDGIDVIMFQETWRRGDGLGEKPRLDGYKTYTNERMGEEKKGGGLAVLVKDNIMSNDWRGDPESEEEIRISKERLWILVHTGNVKLAIVDVYFACIHLNKPEVIRDNEVLVELLARERRELTDLGYKCIVMGDCNARVGHLGVLGERGNDGKVNGNGRLLKNFATDNHMVILNSRPMSQGLFTRHAGREGKAIETVLDYGLINKEDEGMVTSFIIDENNRYSINSDHSTIFMSLKLEGTIQRIKWNVIDKWCTIKNDTDWEKYAGATDSLAMDEAVFENLNAEEQLEHLRGTFKGAWLRCGFKPKRGRGRKQFKKGDLGKSLIPRLKSELFKMKAEGKEGSEEYMKLMNRIERTVEDDQRKKKAFKRKKDRENEETFIRSDKTGMRFFEFIRY